MTWRFASWALLPILALVWVMLPRASATTTDSYPVVAAAGDIAKPNGTGDNATAKLLTGADHVITLGDNAYESGTLNEYMSHYDPSWGVAAKPHTHPITGNHEYRTAGAQGYRQYFGVTGTTYSAWASPHSQQWLMIGWDSNCGFLPKGTAGNGCQPGSPQHTWLKNVLATNTRPCVLIYSHHPRFSVGKHAPGVSSAKPLWALATTYKVDLVLNGHDHNYQRWAKMNGSGTKSATGTRQIVNGEGGGSHYPFTSSDSRVEARQHGTFGVLKLTLKPKGYDGRFVSVNGSFSDTFSAACN